MHEALAPGKELDKCAEVLDGDNLGSVELPDLKSLADVVKHGPTVTAFATAIIAWGAFAALSAVITTLGPLAARPVRSFRTIRAHGAVRADPSIPVAMGIPLATRLTVAIAADITIGARLAIAIGTGVTVAPDITVPVAA